MSTSVSGLSTNFFPSPQNGFTTTLASSISAGAATVPLNSVAGYTNGDIAVLVVDPANSSKQTFTGVVDTAGIQLTSVVWTAGTNVAHTAGATVTDYATATHLAMVSKGVRIAHNQDGTHKSGAVYALPTISDFTNANHDHTSVAKGGAVSATGITNPYKFRYYNTTAQTTTNNGFGQILFNTKDYDAGNNVSSSTFTAPVAGFYNFNAHFSNNGTSVRMVLTLYKNNVIISRGGDITTGAGGVSMADTLNLAANDTVKVMLFTSATTTQDSSDNGCAYFQGSLVSAT